MKQYHFKKLDTIEFLFTFRLCTDFNKYYNVIIYYYVTIEFKMFINTFPIAL